MNNVNHRESSIEENKSWTYYAKKFGVTVTLISALFLAYASVKNKEENLAKLNIKCGKDISDVEKFLGIHIYPKEDVCNTVADTKRLYGIPAKIFDGKNVIVTINPDLVKGEIFVNGYHFDSVDDALDTFGITITDDSYGEYKENLGTREEYKQYKDAMSADFYYKEDNDLSFYGQPDSGYKVVNCHYNPEIQDIDYYTIESPDGTTEIVPIQNDEEYDKEYNEEIYPC